MFKQTLRTPKFCDRRELYATSVLAKDESDIWSVRGLGRAPGQANTHLLAHHSLMMVEIERFDNDPQIYDKGGARSF